MEWRLYSSDLPEGCFRPFELSVSGCEAAKAQLDKLRKHGFDGFIYKGEMKCLKV